MIADVKMTFADLHAAVKVIAAKRGHETWALSVQSWDDNRTTWSLWVADLDRHIQGRTADELLAAYIAEPTAEPSTDLVTIGDCNVAAVAS